MFNYSFSLLMPTLNRPSLLPAIQAILNQTWQYWELLVCGATPDITDPRIKIIPRISENLSQTLNHMVTLATGDVFAITADDDLLNPLALSAVATYLRDNPWLAGQTNGAGGPCTLDALLENNLIPCPAVFWTRDAMEKTGPFDPEHELCFDWDYWIRMWKVVGPPKFIDNVLSEYLDHPEQITHVRAEAVRLDAEAVRRKHFGLE